MKTTTRNALGWWALAGCSAATIGAIVTSGSGTTTFFAIGAWVMALGVALLSGPLRSPGKSPGSATKNTPSSPQ